MKRGDREAAAQFMQVHGPRIQRRIRGKLNQSLRRLWDSLDILSTVGRRLDLMIQGNTLRADSEGELWAWVLTTADNALVDRQRLLKRLSKVEQEDSDFAHVLRSRVAGSGQGSGNDQDMYELLETLVAGIPDQMDRQILGLWLTDTPSAVIAELLGTSPPLVRKRWQRIKESLREQMTAGACA